MKLLRHKKTGKEFIFTEILARHPDMEPVVEGVVITDEAPKAPEPKPALKLEQEDLEMIRGESGSVLPIAKASKQVLSDYAERHFGVNMDRRKSQESLADEVRSLIAAHGHPDWE